MFILPFSNISLRDLAETGGKNASLGEMFNKLTPLGIRIPDGFAVTSTAYRHFLKTNQLEKPLEEILGSLDSVTLQNLPDVGKRCRDLLAAAAMPVDLDEAIREAYRTFAASELEGFSVAIRSSATAEDLPTASFAGQHDSFLNISGEDTVVATVQKCYVSLFNDRAIKYRMDNGFEHMQVALSVGIQHMVRSDAGSAGVAFTLEPESGFRNAIYITGAWGLGENVVQGAVGPDEFLVFKPSLEKGLDAILRSRRGEKEKTMVYADPATGKSTLNLDTSPEKRGQYVLDREEVHALARWCLDIEKHYSIPMDIEWAKDGLTGKMYIVQARPETIHGAATGATIRNYHLTEKGRTLCSGKAVGKSIVSGRACIIQSLADGDKVQSGDIIVADITNPDWNALLKKAVGIVTNKGGRTSHASIVARELGIPAVVGTNDATKKILDGQVVTLSAADAEVGVVYEGKLDWQEEEIDLGAIPPTRTAPMLILANPDRAFELSFYPCAGVGLLRMEFIINNAIQIHPMALVGYDALPDGPDKEKIAALTRDYPDKKQYFINHLSSAVGLVAAAFYPREVIVRMSDFKTNEYADLLGGRHFEPDEENPMLGFRGASRYYHPRYAEGFRLECLAMKRAREVMGLSNVKLMIPFCRTVEEGRKVVEQMEAFGLQRGVDGLEIYMMTEIPSNVILAEEFATHFDGFSIGSNDLTQLTLGIDRDSVIVSELFDERNDAARWMIQTVIDKARKAGVRIGLCGQAPSDFPEYAAFLVEAGIHSISFTPDALMKGIDNIRRAEENN